MLTFIKLIHTLIWGIMASATLYIVYAGLTNTFDILLVISLILLSLEVLILLFNHWTCPLTPLAQKYTQKREAGFDIYLPSLLAKYNKRLFGTLFTFGVSLVLWNWFQL